MRHSKLVLMILSLLLMTTLVPVTQITANSGEYTVHRLTYNQSNNAITEGGSLYSSNSFRDAYNRMISESKKAPHVVVKAKSSRSPMKYVAADRAYIQNYPYRANKEELNHINNLSDAAKIRTYKDQKLALSNLYVESSLETARTYTQAHFKMRVNSSAEVNGKIVHNISFQGFEGYIESVKSDIIPLLYIEKGAPILLGGNEDYYSNPEKAVSMVVKPDFYQVAKNGQYNEISVEYNRTYPGVRGGKLTLGIAPSWLSPGRYYSTNGIQFYKDLAMTVPVYNNGEIGEYYAYYQWLPLKSKSSYGGDDFREYISHLGVTGEQKIKPINGSLSGNEHLFVEYGQKFGINPLLLFAQAAHESGWGTSNLSVNKNNLFGWNAVDSDPNQASGFSDIEHSISEHAHIYLRRYLTPRFSYHFGPSFGNKGSGISVKYASDPYYGEKISSIAYGIDKSMGFKDYNSYELAKLKDKTAIQYYKNPNTSGGTWYTTESIFLNQIVTLISNEKDYIKTNLHVPVVNGEALLNTDMKIGPHFSKLNSEFGYIRKNDVKMYPKHGPNNKIPQEEVIVDNEKYEAVLTESTVLKSEWNASSRNLVNIAKGSKLVASSGNNNWSKVYYNGVVGYVPSKHLKIDDNKPATPEEGLKPHDNSKFSDYIVDSDGAGALNVREYPNSNSTTEVIHKFYDKQIISAAPYEGKWFIVKVGSRYGFVHSEYLVKKTDKPTNVKIGDLNGSGDIDIVDLAMLQSHLLKINILKGDSLLAADIDKSGNVDIVDLARLQSHLLKINLIKE